VNRLARLFRAGPERVEPARPHGLDRVPPDAGATACVVGGGIAGVAAATVLAERGVGVTLLERDSALGGRAGAWSDSLAVDGEAFEMERGFHAFFRQYYNLRALLRRIDPALSFLAPLEDYPVLGPDGAVESFSGLPRRAPFNVATLALRTRSLTLRELARVNARSAARMLAYDEARTYARYDTMTARAYLSSLRFPDRARRMLFDVFSHSFFNPEEDMSAAELLMMFHFYFLGNPEGLIFDVAREPFSTAIWRPFARKLDELGVRTRFAAEVSHLERAGDKRWRVVTATGAIEADAVVLAVTVPALRQIVARSAALDDASWRRDIDALRVTLPFAVLRLWLDRPTRQGRAPFAGTAGVGLLDNISLYHLLEGESRAWAARTRGAVVELHAYAVPEDLDEDAIARDLIAGLYALYEETRSARVLERRFLLRRDCPAFEPGSHARRPRVETPFSGIFLAGDFVRLSFPTALMERAAASGMRAANNVVSAWAVREEVLWSVPTRGLFAGAF